ncbi:MAG: hypothetical protein UU95_C0034G0016 [Parcubacteria group bacterium GW2011_GWC2_42_12]|uniref:DUF5671 domain-containing protein n=2 Tax=Candidatus Falkowiibacteriota TaxID=1752728 RepID=A0A1F5S9J0_9BACT|nr:MAG: hypothetical protein UU43_C0010G0008 [Candidatus Falkowbacteria bacterium GW2011_GWA2_41_14]KKS33365.1 MAG: hypothetical protein UU95_C0034G0016 [Parcubacteria group bacterium GW2011_GWC2_42_12]OGF23380.1 MAG: hypothetical protein A3D45_02700 [Candidatus Falkowbacteria bacterium RIFCSPHIGHO2_02_FULL_42_9]
MEKQNAKFAFFYLLSLVTLVFTALATGVIIFQIINKIVADELSLAPGGFSQDALRLAISAIIIAAPIYFVMMWLINKNLLTGRMEREAGVRRWLTYFILLVSAVVMIGWFIATIGSFLNGELTLKFILKSLTSILISALIFSFYLYDVRREDVSKNNNLVRIYFYGSIAIVAIALAASFFFIDSPLVVRAQKFDQAIINKFSQADYAINAYYGENKKLPADLNALINGGSTYYILASDITDPTTGKIIEYKTTGKDSYELCATFKTANKDQASNKFADKSVYVDTRWLHNSGYQCLKQRVALLDNTKPAPISVPVR